MTKGGTSAPAWTPTEVAQRCEALGARVVLKGSKYRIYPPSGGGPVYFSAVRGSHGSHLPNVLTHLRSYGLNLLAAEQAAQGRRPAEDTLTARPRVDPAVVSAVQVAMVNGPTTTTTEQETTMATPRPTPPPTPPTPITFNVRQEMASLRDAVTEQVDAAMEMLADAERRIVTLESEVAQLRSSGLATRGPSLSELCRRAVLVWFQAHPGMRITPQLLELNLGDALPQGYGKTMVAHGCFDLVQAGRLKGGGTKAGESASRGIYWYDPQLDKGDAGPEVEDTHPGDGDPANPQVTIEP